MHAPLQFICPDAHADITHTPPLQLRPAVHVLPHAPQFMMSIDLSVQLPAHSVSGE
jgi:hypothetical protein